MRSSIWKAATLAAILALVLGACTRGEDPEPAATGGQDQAATETETAQTGETASALDRILEAGTVRCGVNNTVPGFGYDPGDGTIDGFDIEFCRAFAAALFNTDSPEEGTHYELVPIDADNRFIALRDGEFDVLVRNTTWTSSREGTEGVQFTKTNFFDGQAMLVPANINSIDQLDGATICVTAGTTTELNLADYLQERNIAFEPLTLEDYDAIFRAFRTNRCDAVTGDRSALAGLAPGWSEEMGEELTILEDVMSKEPLTPGVLEGDSDWADVVFWVTNGIILAEELGVTQQNVAQEAQNPSTPQIAALLGTPFAADEEVNVEHGLGIDDTFMQNVIAAVGNYGEIFDRHLGPNTEIGLERGLNALWTDGGLQYGIPFR